jgi:hypothetical protein
MRIVSLLALASSTFFVGCGDNGSDTSADAPTGAPDSLVAVDAPSFALRVSGTVVGPAAPAAGPIIAAWPTGGPSGDYVYKFGDGTSSGATFSMDLASIPPEMARNLSTMTDVGVGLLALLPPGTSIPDGVLASEPTRVGITASYGIVYRGPTDTSPYFTWTSAFPFGLSCGRCVYSTTGGHDAWEPVGCTALVMDTDMNASTCNWR